MDWRKAPVIIREIRLAWIIPEIRKPVLATVACRLGVWTTMPITVALLAIPIAMAFGGEVIKVAGEWLCRVIPNPTSFFHHRKRLLIESAQDVMSIEEIQRRAYGPPPNIRFRMKDRDNE